MDIVTALGIVSMVFCIGFTVRNAKVSSIHGGQSLRESLMEAWTNIVIGFSVNYAANFLLLPLIGADLTLGNNFWLGCIYTAISFMRQFIIRRFYNNRLFQRAKG
jgi:hypothetical protein